MTNGNDELSDDAKGRGVTVQECEGAGVRWRWGAMALEREGTGVRRSCAAKGAGCDGAGRCRMVRDGTGRHNRAQPGAGGASGRNRAQLGAEGGLAALQTL